MKKLLRLACLLIACLSFAAERQLLLNGTLSSETSPIPENWSFRGTDGTLFTKGGPDSLPFVVYSSPQGQTTEYSEMRQSELHLVQGEKYRLSCKVKTKDFKARMAVLYIIDNGWFHSFGIQNFPVNSEWTTVTRDITLGMAVSQEKGVKSPGIMKGPYSFTFYLSQYSGEISIADLKLEPLTPKAKAESQNALDRLGKYLKPIPIHARAEAFPADLTVLPIFWGVKTATAKILIDGQPVTAEVPNIDGVFQLNVSAYRQGRHIIDITVFDNGRQVAANSFPFRYAEPELPCPEEHRLNTMTTELVNAKLVNAASASFTVPRRTWVYVKLESASCPTVTLSGDANPLITPALPRPEAQRRLQQGRYTVCFDAPFTGTLIVRTVPILYKYAGINVTAMPGIGGEDLEFHKQHAFGVFNTIGARGVPKDLRPYTKTLGIECVDAMSPPSQKEFNEANVASFVKNLNSPSGVNADPSSEWTEFDEYFWNNTSGLFCSVKGLEQFRNTLNKDLFHWFAGSIGPDLPYMHHQVMSTILNSGNSRGYLAYEVYFRPSPTETEARANIAYQLSHSCRNMNRFIPGSNSAFGYIFGNFHQLPVLSVDWLPQVNFKYFLDMQFHYLATHPEFNGIALTGYWGFNYVNEEVARWCCELVRHYVLEGKTTMLSEKYGYTYLLPHVANGDFDDKLSEWTCHGNVTTQHVAHFGGTNQLRYGCSQFGNSMAVLSGNADTRPSVSQTVTGLVPGKTYYLEFMTADYDDTIAQKLDSRKFDITPTLENARILHEFTYVDNRPQGRYGAVTAKTNYRYYRFVPAAQTMKLTFTGSAKDGERLALNYVRVAPYFEK